MRQLTELTVSEMVKKYVRLVQSASEKRSSRRTLHMRHAKCCLKNNQLPSVESAPLRPSFTITVHHEHLKAGIYSRQCIWKLLIFKTSTQRCITWREVLKHQMKRRFSLPSPPKELEAFLLEEWRSVPLHTVQDLYGII
uniref:Uncharacterized protein n=1 Tax=Erpetoichthys calabaricus TaxID=27687 RepID=A0A8C4SMM0_ERPCA